MQSVDAKARVVCHKLNIPDDGTAFSIIRHALKEQDRDTRHTCAEACTQATSGSEHLQIVSTAFHDICMNVKAV
jgi:hypothetical protein